VDYELQMKWTRDEPRQQGYYWLADPVVPEFHNDDQWNVELIFVRKDFDGTYKMECKDDELDSFPRNSWFIGPLPFLHSRPQTSLIP